MLHSVIATSITLVLGYPFVVLALSCRKGLSLESMMFSKGNFTSKTRSKGSIFAVVLST